MYIVLKNKLKTKIFFSEVTSWLLAILAIFSNLNLLTSLEIIFFGSNKPLFYKISGTWGNHEGSLLLWINILVLFSSLFLFINKNRDKKFKILTLLFQNLLIIIFLIFLLIIKLMKEMDFLSLCINFIMVKLLIVNIITFLILY